MSDVPYQAGRNGALSGTATRGGVLDALESRGETPMDRPDIDGIREELVRWGDGDYPNVRPLLSYIEQLEAERERFIQALGDIPQGIMTPTARALLDGSPMQRGVGGYPNDVLRDAGRGHLAEP